MSGALAALGVLSAISGIGNQINENNRINRAESRFDKAVDQVTFNPEDLYATYQYYNDPLLYDTYLLDDTAYNNISVNPSVLNAQNRALDELINLSEAKGLDAIDQQALDEIIASENRNLQGQNQALAQEAMQRGIYGSGLEMAQRLQNAQSSANRMNDQDMNVMSQAQQRALEALSNYGNLASNMRTQDFGEQEKIANANDIINKANWENRQNMSNSNIDTRNKVNMANTELYNKQQDSNVQSAQNVYNNKATKAALQTDQYTNSVQNSQHQADRTDKLIGTLSSSIGSFADSSDKKKENQ